MSVEWSRLRVLDAVARTGSVRRAAALLHMTGPAVSQQLRRIEAEAGLRIVIPNGRGIRLTDEGQVLADYAAQVAELMTRAENDLHVSDALVGYIYIGALASIIRSTLSSRLSDFQRCHPFVKLRVEDGETTWHMKCLIDGRLDMVVAESWSSSPLTLPAGTSGYHLAREPVWIALPADHHLLEKTVLDLSDLANEVWATCAPGSDAHQALLQSARASGIEPDIRHYVADHFTQLTLVHAGLAIACVPDSARQNAGTGIDYRKLNAEMHRDIFLLTNDRILPRAVEALIAYFARQNLSFGCQSGGAHRED